MDEYVGIILVVAVWLLMDEIGKMINDWFDYITQSDEKEREDK